MKKNLWLAIIFISVALFSLPFALGIVDSQRERVVITEEVISGDPEAAEGVTLQFLTHWKSLALWDTKYTIGTGETVTEFEFEEDGVYWPKQESEYLDFNIPVNFGTAVAVGDGMNATRDVDLYGMWIPEVLVDVATRAKVGSSYTEIVSLADYYKYYPLELSVRSEAHDMSFYSNGVDYFSDFFHVEVPADEKLSVTITKNPDGIITAVDCNSSWEGADGWQEDGLSIDTAYAFGEAGCFFTYICTERKTGERVLAGENTGIFYAPYVEENRRFTISKQVKKVCEIPSDMVPAEMIWDEERGELYMAAKVDEEYRLYIYSVAGEKVELTQELTVWSSEELLKTELPFYREMTLEKDGILLKWSDGSFSFVAEEEGGYYLWCSNTFVPDVAYLEELARTGNQPIEVGYLDEIFSYEHALYFDGERMVLASYDSWDSVNVTVAVYNREKQLYCGRYRHSAESDRYLKGLSDEQVIATNGSSAGRHRRKTVEYQPLKIWVE